MAAGVNLAIALPAILAIAVGYAIYIGCFALLSQVSAGDAFNILVGFLPRLDGVVFRDPTGGIDGQEGVVPGGVRALGAVRGGVRVVAEFAVAFAVSSGQQALSAGSAPSLA